MDEMKQLLFEGILYAMEGEDPSKAIEDFERRGTINMARTSKLPKKTNGLGVPFEIRSKNTTDEMSFETRRNIIQQNNYEYTKAQYEKMGIKILDEYDDLFLSVELPEGWEIRTTGHSMWNEVYDNNGRRRIQYFYKAVSYDRDAFTNFDCRYNFRIEPFDKYESDATYEERMLKPWTVVLTDSGEVTKILDTRQPNSKVSYQNIQDELRDIGQNYINEHFPNWNDINAYWDD